MMAATRLNGSSCAVRAGERWIEIPSRIYSRDGSYVGTVELAFQPITYIPLRIRQQRIYAVVSDSLDIPFVVRTAPCLKES
jgi:hypothetical protein